ncbi:uncharacterized protein LOC100842201 isoform X1 [Brachypodium distachyon]|uniref:Amine oxidase domain-containing protein n=1 Tax=Brachypodium distachyon TaxID=15368 RepID=A0A0Q3KP96_BRADI|nr:uncharacterized protein LOC100842201 isoform X1 [Brachypodium distachyon]KQJ81717.1 hypothetical protein BRADI_5g02490v3 [Brachypodium distachyon]|eukprot:XP_003581006.1 uncharacterized protein LOC100842201 isoform X1 [Brachypodium distachyon]
MEKEITRVAVVGAGVSGLAAAHELCRAGGNGVRVTVYEAEERLGGHARTADVDGVQLDLGFMVFNRVTYPNMLEWFEGLGVEMETSDMSLSVSTQLSGGGRCEWGSRNGLSGLLAQKSNALRPGFWHMIREILKFKEDVLSYLSNHENNPDLDRNETLGEFIKMHGYSQLFQEAYLIPICACIWSCPSQGVLGFSAFFVLSFCRNHHLLQIFGRPQWLTIKGRSHSYVNKVREELESMGCRIKTNCQVKSVSSFEGGHRVLEVDGSEEVYDKIIFGAHAPDALRMLRDEATHEELRILGAFQYVYSDIYLHRDKSLMPRNSSAWSAWNFLGTTSSGVSVTYWLNLLQNIESKGRPFLVTLNPPHVPDHVLLKWNTSHPVPSVAAAKASLELNQIQGKRGIWFCGAYQGYGFHEDGSKAGKSAAQGLLGKKIDLLLNPKQMVPSWTEAGARLLVTRFLNQYITIGNLTILEQGGTMFSFGEVDKKCLVKSVLRVHDPLFYWKVATEADLGLADAYVNGYFSFVDKREGLLNLFLILIANRDTQKSSSSAASKRGWWTPLLLTAGIASAKYFLRHVSRKNTVTQTRQNISQHYDLSNDFFSLFLDPSMTYSCAIFKVEDESLEVAQLRKVNLLIDKAKVERDHHVLEIGSGWGCLAMQVVKQTGCKYTGITLSEEQLKYAQMKVKEAGLEDRITFLLCDYRQIPILRKYDRIISCEMIEGVGHEFMDDFFGCCESLLAQDGLLVLQFISIPEERYEEYRRSSDFIKEYIFPGGCLPSLARITSAMSAASRLCIEQVENIGYHYYPTLVRWRDNFFANKYAISALGFDDKFIRIWEYYFMYCAAGFKSRTLGNYQIVFSRPGNDKLAYADNPYASLPAA